MEMKVGLLRGLSQGPQTAVYPDVTELALHSYARNLPLRGYRPPQGGKTERIDGRLREIFLGRALQVPGSPTIPSLRVGKCIIAVDLGRNCFSEHEQQTRSVQEGLEPMHSRSSQRRGWLTLCQTNIGWTLRSLWAWVRLPSSTGQEKLPYHVSRSRPQPEGQSQKDQHS